MLKDASPSTLLGGIGDVLAGRRAVPADVAQGLPERAYQSDLSPREYEVLQQLVNGLSNKQIASELGLTEATVKTHLTHILEKLGVEDRARAALAAVKRGILRT